MTECQSGVDAPRELVERVFRECFHDEDVYIDLYERWMLPGSHVVSMRLDGCIAGLITFFPAAIIDGGERLTVAHSYALGTFEAFRGQGVARELMLACDREMAALGARAHIGSPDSLSLFGYYDRIGYLAKNHILRLLPNGAGGHEGITLEPCELTAGAYIKRRGEYYGPRTPFVELPEFVLEYYLREVATDGGELLRVLVDGREAGLALCSREEDEVLCRDLLVDEAELSGVLAALTARYRGERLAALLPYSSPAADGRHGEAHDYIVMCAKPLDTGGEVGFCGALSRFERCFSSLLCHVRAD